MEPEPEEKKELNLDDQYLAGYFHLLITTQKLKDFTISPLLKTPKSVSWKIKGDNLLQELEKIYNGVEVPLLGYIQSLKEMKNQIAVLKG